LIGIAAADISNNEINPSGGTWRGPLRKPRGRVSASSICEVAGYPGSGSTI
jgi:hypothetical protein